MARTSLARLVTEIRKATGDSARGSRYVRNVHGFGYAFCGEAEAGARTAHAPAACSLLWGEREIPLPEGESLIGRTPACRVVIDSPQVSRLHARVYVAAGRATVEDLGSKNGTFLDERRIERPTRLADGSRLIVGPALLAFRGPSVDDSTKTGTSSRR